MSVSSKKLVKVKRPRVDWFSWLWYLAGYYSQYELLCDFSDIRKSSKVKSFNRLAYTVLKKHYSTTALACMRYLSGVNPSLSFSDLYELL